MNLSTVTTYAEHPQSVFFSQEYQSFSKNLAALVKIVSERQGLTIQFRSFVQRAKLLKQSLDRLTYDPQAKRNFLTAQYNNVVSSFTQMQDVLQSICTFAQLNMLNEQIQQTALASLDAFAAVMSAFENLRNDVFQSQRDFNSARKAQLTNMRRTTGTILEQLQPSPQSIPELMLLLQEYAQHTDQLITVLQAQNQELRQKYPEIEQKLELSYAKRIELLESEIKRLKGFFVAKVCEK